MCDQCQAERERAERIAEDMLLVEQEKRGLLRRINALKTELSRQRKEHPNAVAAKRLFDHWVTALGKNANTVYGEKREKALLERLVQFSEDDLRLAIDGMASVPYVGRKGRQHDAGYGAKRHDELTIVMADETTVERFMGYGREAKGIMDVSGMGRVNVQPIPASMLERCDCGHMRLEHSKADPNRFGAQPCLHGGCECIDFDNLHRLADEWLRSHRERLKGESSALAA